MPGTRFPARFLVEARALDSAPWETRDLDHWPHSAECRIGGQAVRVRWADPELVLKSADGQVLLLLYGEVYNETLLEKKAYLLEQYRTLGPGFIGEVNGSFAIVILDQAEGRLLACTDRVNSKKLIYSSWQGTARLSNDLRLHPLDQFSVDETGLACYLANGNLLNRRTLYNEAQTLERASLHRLVEGRVESTLYWQYNFHYGAANVPKEALIRDFGDRIVEAVRVRVKGSNLISLSSGYDSTVILGVLGVTLKLPGVRAFSYFYANRREDSDESIAARMAAVYGYPHEMIQSYAGNLADVVNRNAALGEGMCNFCDEVDAWVQYGQQNGNMQAALFAGDECFGGANTAPIESNADALKRAYVYPFRSLAWMKPLIGGERWARWNEGVDGEFDALNSKAAHIDDFRARRDFYFLDQRIGGRMMPWREYFPGRYFSVESPFLDNGILDFMEGLPGEMRRGKRFFKETAEVMYPALFRIPRAATSSYAGYWLTDLRKQRANLEKLLEEPGKSRLDALISPEITRSLLRMLTTAQPLHAGYDGVVRVIRKAAGDGRRGRFATTTDTLKMVMRLLLLRQVLADGKDRP